MTVRLANITLDCGDVASVSAFWSAALGRDLDEGSSGFFASIGMADESQPRWLFAKVPETKSAKNRMHVDMAADDRVAEVARLVELGATHVDDREEWGHAWSVMADVEGNEFCVAGA